MKSVPEWSAPAPVSKIGADASGAPIIVSRSPVEDYFPESRGARRWKYDYENDATLEALGINLESETLVVSFHGTLNREQYTIPRFERMSSLCKLGVNSLYFSDPTLCLSDDIQLGWYIGWPSASIFEQMAEQCIRVATRTNARRILLSGSSGGGYAALQVSALIPGSVAVVFNPQTYVHGYHDDGNPNTHAAERKFIEVAYPDAAPEGIWKIDFEHDWTQGLGSKYSVLRKYNLPALNNVVYCNNLNDWHVEQHFQPFMNVARAMGMDDRIRVVDYNSSVGHRPPNVEEFNMGILAGIEFADERESIGAMRESLDSRSRRAE